MQNSGKDAGAEKYSLKAMSEISEEAEKLRKEVNSLKKKLDKFASDIKKNVFRVLIKKTTMNICGHLSMEHKREMANRPTGLL